VKFEKMIKLIDILQILLTKVSFILDLANDM